MYQNTVVCKLQRDGHNCGIWAMWLSEQWMQLVIGNTGMQPMKTKMFDLFYMEHMTPMPKEQTLRLHYHNMMQNAQTPDLSKQTYQLQDMAPTKNAKTTSDTAQTLHATAQDAPTAADETATNVSEHEPKGGRACGIVHRHAEVATSKHMYLEKQDKQHCQVHSSNALLGRKAVSPHGKLVTCRCRWYADPYAHTEGETF